MRPGPWRSRGLAAAVLALRLGLVAAAGAGEGDERERLLEQGAAHYQARRYYQAIEAFEKALERSEGPEAAEVRGWLARALGMLGVEYLSSGEVGHAETAFERALEHAADFYALAGLGYVHFLRLEEVRAETELEQAVAQAAAGPDHGVRPDDLARAHKLLALLAYRKGETERALEALGKALGLRPGDLESQALERRWRVEVELSARFRREQSRHFTARVDPRIPPRVAASVLSELEAAREALGERLGFWPREAVPVVLFSPEAFRRATGSFEWVEGLYDGQLKLPVPSEAATGLPPAFGRTVRHEVAHVLVRGLASECPVWLNEGLAQYLEGPADREGLRQRLLAGKDRRVPLSRIPARLWEVDDPALARWIYLEGLGFVDFLAAGYHEFRLRLLLRALAEEHSVSRAVERSYGARLEDLEARWWESLEESPAAPEAEGR